MNDIVRKACERRVPTVKKRFDFVGDRVLFDACEDFGSLIFG
jgi:hypothetical protein